MKTIAQTSIESGSPCAAALTPSGGTLLIATRSGTVELLSTPHFEKESHRKFNSTAGDARSIAVSRTDGTIAVAGERPQVGLFDATSFEPGGFLGNHVGGVQRVSFAPDGNHFVSAGHDGVVQVTLLEDKSVVFSDDGHRDAITAMTVSNRGLVASGALDHTIRFMDLEHGAVVGRVTGLDGVVRMLAFNPAGGFLAALIDDHVVVYDAASRLEKRRVKVARPIISIAFSDDDRLVCGAADGSLVTLHLETGELSAPVELSKSGVAFLVPSPVSTEVYAITTAGEVFALDSEDDEA